MPACTYSPAVLGFNVGGFGQFDAACCAARMVAPPPPLVSHVSARLALSGLGLLPPHKGIGRAVAAECMAADRATAQCRVPGSKPAMMLGCDVVNERLHVFAVRVLCASEECRTSPAAFDGTITVPKCFCDPVCRRPQVKRRLSLGSSRARPESGGGRARGGLLTKRQWVLLGLSAAVVSLQLLILWRFAALAGGGGSAVVASAAAPVQLKPPLDLSSTAPLLGGGPAGGAAYGSMYPAGATEAAAADGAWSARMQLLAGDVDVMRQRLELLARDLAAAAAAAVPGAAAGFATGDASCAAPGGACAADAAGA